VKRPHLYFRGESGGDGLARSRNPRAARLYSGSADWLLGLTLEGSILQVSDGFCSFLGYQRQELLGKKIEAFTARRTLDVSKHLAAIHHFGWFAGLWLFVGQGGKPALVHYVAALGPDLTIEMRLVIPEHLQAVPGAGKQG